MFPPFVATRFERNPEDGALIMLGWADRDHALITQGMAVFGPLLLLRPVEKER